MIIGPQKVNDLYLYLRVLDMRKKKEPHYKNNVKQTSLPHSPKHSSSCQESMLEFTTCVAFGRLRENFNVEVKSNPCKSRTLASYQCAKSEILNLEIKAHFPKNKGDGRFNVRDQSLEFLELEFYEK